jgi:dipeptidase E
MKLFLASKIDHTIDKLIDEYALKPNETSTIFVPTAQNRDNPPGVLEEMSSYIAFKLRQFPLIVVDLEQETEISLKEKLRQTKLIVIVGGNSYYLLYQMKRSGFTSLLPELLANGVVYAGSSAGSCVCSPSIAYIKDQDDPTVVPELKDYSGLNLVDFDIYPHCLEDWYESRYSSTYVTEMLKSPNNKIFLRDHQAVVVHDNWYKIV